MIGKRGIEETFDQKFSNRFNIHRTRQNFPGDGIDTFENMAQMGLLVTDRVVKEEMGGSLDSKKNLGDTTWINRMSSWSAVVHLKSKGFSANPQRLKV